MTVLGLYAEWKNYGGLPEPGGLYDQEAPLAEALKICERAHHEAERKRDEEET